MSWASDFTDWTIYGPEYRAAGALPATPTVANDARYGSAATEEVDVANLADLEAFEAGEAALTIPGVGEVILVGGVLYGLYRGAKYLLNQSQHNKVTRHIETRARGAPFAHPLSPRITRPTPCCLRTW